jgi:hypothetical protein
MKHLKRFNEAIEKFKYSKKDIEDAYKFVNVYARSARFEPEFDAETYYYDKIGTPNSFTYLEKNQKTSGGGKVKSANIVAYDKKGKLVGLLSISLTEPVGAFKIVVAEDSARKGWGLKLLDEAEKRGFDMVNYMKNNTFTHSGRRLCEKWLEIKLEKFEL